VDFDETQAADSVGTRGIPQNTRSAAYTLIASDAGKHILHPSTDANARTFTIPGNASVAYPVGTQLTFVNQVNAGPLDISIATDTMYVAGVGASAKIGLQPNGIVSALKLAATEWIISGFGIVAPHATLFDRFASAIFDRSGSAIFSRG